MIADSRPGSDTTGDHDDVTRSMDAVRAIVRALRINTRAIELKIGISLAQLFVLQQVAERPAESLNDLAERTATHQSSVSSSCGGWSTQGSSRAARRRSTNAGGRSPSRRQVRPS